MINMTRFTVYVHGIKLDNLEWNTKAVNIIVLLPIV